WLRGFLFLRDTSFSIAARRAISTGAAAAAAGRESARPRKRLSWRWTARAWRCPFQGFAAWAETPFLIHSRDRMRSSRALHRSNTPRSRLKFDRDCAGLE